MTFPTKLAGVMPLLDRYDAFIFDVWGVLHNGARPFPGVVDTLRHLKMVGKKVYLLSNAPRLVPYMLDRLDKIGITSEMYDGAHTSGEDVHDAFKSGYYAELGDSYAYLGATPTQTPLMGLPYFQVNDVGSAHFILNTGPAADENPQLESYRPWLNQGLSAGIPMICANPDLYVLVGDRRVLCAGAVANLYEEMGGEVFYHGKPYTRMYDSILKRLPEIEKARVVTFGDSFTTDIRGANRAGIDCVFMESGIYGDHVRCAAPEEAYRRLMEEYECRPTYIMPTLAL